MNTTPEFIVEIIKRYWTPGKKILEIGCGPAFMREFFGADYTGTDITDEPYHPHIPRNVDIVCSAENLLVADESFDIVVIKCAFYLFSDHLKALKEAQRVLKPNGQILIFDYNRKTQIKLQKNESLQRYPCWTQWGLKSKLKQAGYSQCQIISGGGRSSFYQALKNELRTDWAIVTGSKV